MTEPTVSVIVVSHGRPKELALCLKALTYQYRRNFEIVVVHNSLSEPGIELAGVDDEVKTVLLDTPNISAARNLGVDIASGEIIAFVDDDAIAEPTWLERLVAPFLNPKIVASGGFVRGRNGFDYQWAGEVVDDFGQPTPLELTKTAVVAPKPNAYAKTHGTNCAFRRSTLVDFHGFDESFHFFLDETDLNIRIGKAGRLVALVPGAEVHHYFSASVHRTATRAPKSLFEIGASTAYFNKKHGLSEQQLEGLFSSQHERLKQFVVSGKLEPRDIGELLKSLEKGIKTGRSRPQNTRSINAESKSGYLNLDPIPRQNLRNTSPVVDFRLGPSEG